MKSNQQLLKNTLLANALFSLVSAILVLVIPESLSQFLGISTSFWLELIGYGLLGFSILVVFVALKRISHTAWVWLIIIQDVLWVIGSLIVLLVQPWGLTGLGLGLIAAVAAVISLFAYFQWLYNAS